MERTGAGALMYLVKNTPPPLPRGNIARCYGEKKCAKETKKTVENLKEKGTERKDKDKLLLQLNGK